MSEKKIKDWLVINDLNDKKFSVFTMLQTSQNLVKYQTTSKLGTRLTLVWLRSKVTKNIIRNKAQAILLGELFRQLNYQGINYL